MFNKNFLLILATSVLLGIPMTMLIILGSLVGASLAPDPRLITVAVSAQLLAGILVAAPLSLLMGRFGRQKGFLLIAGVTVIGGLLAAFAVYQQHFWTLCLAHLLLGAALIGVNYLRFAAAEAVSEAFRPNAISLTLAMGLIAAFVGPSLFDASKDWLGTVPFAGAYMAIAALGLLGMLPIAGFSLATPAVVETPGQASRSTFWQVWKSSAQIRLAITIAAVSQGVMVLMMVPTPQAMIEVGYTQSHAADVIRWHVIAMFAPGLFTGLLIKRIGLNRVIGTGLLLLLGSALVALSGTGSNQYYTALVLLGVGWNFGFIGSTNMLQQVTIESEKAQLQGLNDTLIAVAAVAASIVSGLIYVAAGWHALAAIIAIITSVALLAFIFNCYRGAARTLVQ